MAETAARLACFALTAQPGPDPLATMALSLFDWAACTLAGAHEPVAHILRAQAEAEGGAAQASLAGAPALRVPARAAALVNGTVSHALDYDDTHFGPVSHPAVAVLPAALAVAERQGADGAAALAAGLIGAEGALRVGLWLGERHAAAGFHTTGTSGAFGATLAAGRLLGLDAERLGHALGIVATRAGGLRAQFGTMGKPLNAGLAAAAGVEAADLAAAGFVSDPAAVDGPEGFLQAHAGEGNAAALSGLGARWEMTGIRHKLHACCHGLHAMLEALGGVRLDPGSIDRVTVRTHPRWRAVCAKPAPRTGLEAKFSYSLAAAMALAGRDTAALDTFSDAACTDPALIRLRDRVDVVFDAAVAPTASVVDVTAAAGRQHRLTHDLAAPLDPARVERRLRDKARALLGAERAPALADATLDAAGGRSAPDLAALAALLRGA